MPELRWALYVILAAYSTTSPHYFLTPLLIGLGSVFAELTWWAYTEDHGARDSRRQR